MLGICKRVVREECRTSYIVRLDWLKQHFKGKASEESTPEEWTNVRVRTTTPKTGFCDYNSRELYDCHWQS